MAIGLVALGVRLHRFMVAQVLVHEPALVEDVLPVLDALVVPELDAHAAARLQEMHERYAAYISRIRSRSPG